MSSSDVTNVTSFFPSPNEGFTTTLSGSITAGATSVGLASTSGLTNGQVFVGIIEPGTTSQQVFTGTVDTSGSQITGVVWTRGTNIGHSAGVTIVDYVSGTHIKMITAGLLKEHTPGGLHSKINGNTVPAGADTVALIAASQTLTNKSISGNTNTFTNLPFSSLLSTIFGDQVTSASNTGSAGGSNRYINLGGIKILWGVSGNAWSLAAGNQTTSQVVNFPASFFNTVTYWSANATALSGDGRQHAFVTTTPTTGGMTVSIQSWDTGSTTGGFFSWLVVGT